MSIFITLIITRKPMFSRNSYKKGIIVSNIPYKHNPIEILMDLFSHLRWDNVPGNPNLILYRLLIWNKYPVPDSWKTILNKNPYGTVEIWNEIIKTLRGNPYLLGSQQKFDVLRYMVRNPNISQEIILSCLDRSEDDQWWTLSNQRYLSRDFVLSHKELPWNWVNLAKNPSIVRENPPPFDTTWDLQGLLRNPNITPEILCMYGIDITQEETGPYFTGALPYRNELLDSDEVSPHIVRKYPNLGWKYKSELLCEKRQNTIRLHNQTCEYEKTQSRDIDWFLRDPHITLAFFKKNPTKFNSYHVSTNRFGFDLYYSRNFRKYACYWFNFIREE